MAIWKAIRRSLVAGLTLLVIPHSGWALDARPDMSLFDPTTDDGRYLSVHDAETFLQGRWTAHFWFDYARKPIELRNVVSDQRFDIVRDYINIHVGGAYGITDWLTAGVSLPVTLWQVFFDPNQQRLTLGNAPKQTKAGLGDLLFETKFRILDIERHGFGLAVVPYMLFPTGKKGSFISGERWSPGAKLAGEVNLGDRVWLALNVGYQYVSGQNQYFSGNPDALIDDLLQLGVGARVKVTDEWAFMGEVVSETVAKNAFQVASQTPLEVVGGVQFAPQKSPSLRGLAFTLAGGGGVTTGVGAPKAHVMFGVSYPSPKIVSVSEPTAVIEEKIVISQKVHFAFNSAEIRDVSYPILNDVVALLQANPNIGIVRVEGHTDWIGSDEYNMRLSDSRSQSVVNYLVDHGVDPNRLVSEGYGESRPVADNNTDEGRARNRRTEFTILE